MKTIDEICARIDEHREIVEKLRVQVLELGGGNSYLYWIETEPTRRTLLSQIATQTAIADALKWTITGEERYDE